MTVRLVVIVGPTATGKTRLGVDIAHLLGSAIVSADSRQVYIGLDLGAGKDLAEYTRVTPPVPYHLIDVVPPQTTYTLFDYQRDCYRLLRAWDRSRREPLVMVGGSGLYVEAVLRQYRIPDVPEDAELRQRLMGEAHEVLVERLRAQHAKLYERTDTSSTKRVVRALEIAAHCHSDGSPRLSASLGVDLEFMVFGLRLSRAMLHRRIQRRLEERLEQGMVDEVRQLLAAGLTLERLQLLGMEYRHIANHLRGATPFEQMKNDLAAGIRQLAKRQETYLRGMVRRGTAITWIAPDDDHVVLEALRERRWL